MNGVLNKRKGSEWPLATLCSAILCSAQLYSAAWELPDPWPPGSPSPLDRTVWDGVSPLEVWRSSFGNREGARLLEIRPSFQTFIQHFIKLGLQTSLNSTHASVATMILWAVWRLILDDPYNSLVYIRTAYAHMILLPLKQCYIGCA
jgi:hypothetical protein